MNTYIKSFLTLGSILVFLTACQGGTPSGTASSTLSPATQIESASYINKEVGITDGKVLFTQVVSDSNNNLYVAGWGNESGVNLAIVQKYDSNGNLLWNNYTLGKQNDPTTTPVAGWGLTLDNQNNVYVTGNVKGSSGNYNAFVAKLDATTGATDWFTPFGSTNTNDGSYTVGLSVNVYNNITYISGSTVGGNLDGNHAIPKDELDEFIAAFDTSGNIISNNITQLAVVPNVNPNINKGTYGSFSNGYSTVDATGIYLSGNTSGESSINNIATSTATAKGNAQQGFVTKYDFSGNVQWTALQGGSDNTFTSVSKIKVNSGVLYFTGTTSDNLAVTGQDGQNPNNYNSAIFATLNPNNGNLNLVKLYNGPTNNAYGNSITVYNNTVYITGSVIAQTVNGLQHGYLLLTYNNMAKLQSKPTITYATGPWSFDGLYTEGRDVAVNTNGNVYTVGITSGNFNGNNLTGGIQDGFLLQVLNYGIPQ